MKHYYTLYSGGKELYELNKSLWKPGEQISPGYFNVPHILIIGANPRLVTPDMMDDYRFMFDLQDYDEFEETYRNVISSTALSVTSKTLNVLCDLKSEYVSFTNIIKEPTTTEDDITEDMKIKYVEVTKKQIELFKPLLVIPVGSLAKKLLIGEDAEFNHIYQIDNVYYYPLYHYSYLLRHGTSYLEGYYTKSKTEINEILKTHALIQVTNRLIFYRDIDGKKQSYENPVKNSPLYVPDKNGEYLSIYDEPLAVKTFNNFNSVVYQKGFMPETMFGVGREIDYVHFYKFTVYDIETDFCNTPENPTKRVLSVATYHPLLNKSNIIVLDNEKHSFPSQYKEFKVIVCKTEEELLSTAFEVFSYFDMIVGWFSNSFDIMYLVNRAKMLNVDIKKAMPQYVPDNEPISKYPPKCEGLSFIDAAEIFKFIANSLTSEESGTVSRNLSNVGQLLLGESKVDLPPSQIPFAWENDPEKFLEYASQDVRLTWGVLREGKLLDILYTRQLIAKLNAEKLMYNSQVIENILLRSYPEYKFPSRIKRNKDEELGSIPGGLVLPTIPGLYKNVVVFDFSGMYPSLIMTFNISPEVLVGANKSPLANRNVEVNGIAFSTHKVGMMVEVEQKLKNWRKQYKMKVASTTRSMHTYYYVLQDSIKQLMNSMYGVLSYIGFLLYDPRVGTTITTLGQKMLDYIKSYAESHGYKVLYGDTDSIFIKFPDSLNIQELKDSSYKMQTDLNSALHKFAEQYNHDAEYLKKYYSLTLEVDKIFSKFKITDAKKRYFGMLENNGTSKLYIKGFETRRHDTPAVFMEAYREIYKYILDDNVSGLTDYIRNFKKSLPTLPTEKFVMHIKIGKKPEEYDRDYEIVRAANSVDTNFQRGDTLNMLYTINGEVHYQGQDVSVDYDRYFDKFIIGKLLLLDKNVYDMVLSSINGQKKLIEYGMPSEIN